MGDRATKDALYDGFAVVAKALASGRRAEIVDVLSQGERSVEELAAEIGPSVATTSQHLRHLAGAGLVRTRRDGNRVFYAPTSPQVTHLWAALRAAAADHVAQIDRPAADYHAGHILGARSVPIAELPAELGRLTADQDIVAYCRGPYCVYADDAVRELRRRGLPARRLEDGYPEWAGAGLPTASG